MNQFSYQKSNRILAGKQIYRRNEYSFDFIPASPDFIRKLIGDKGSTSLSIDTLQIEVSIQQNRLLYVWGYYPWFKWKKKDLPEMNYSDGEVFLSEQELVMGVSIDIDASKNWFTLYDEETGRIVVTYTENFADANMIRITNDTLLGLKKNMLQCLCIHPQFITS